MDGTLLHRTRPADGEPIGGFVLLHGRGADENDLFPLFDMLDPDRRLVGATVRGPLSLPPGGAHWYVVRQVGYPDPETFFPTFERLTSWFDSWSNEVGLPTERIAIGGFSQGAVMSYALSLGKGRPSPAALMALSGFMPQVEGFELDLARGELPIAIGHGVYDPVIQVGFGRDARERLQTADIEPLYRESPMDHTIDPDFIFELQPWLAKAIDSRSPS
jgi:phospholipase/carboxylesterase